MKTIKVRIPVAINGDGDWFAEHSSFLIDDGVDDYLYKEIPDHKLKHIVWVEARIPMPTKPATVTVQGKVVE